MGVNHYYTVRLPSRTVQLVVQAALVFWKGLVLLYRVTLLLNTISCDFP